MMKMMVRKAFGGGDAGASAPIAANVGAMGLLIFAVRANGSYTEVEQERASKASMKLLQLSNAAAASLRQSAEDCLADGATAAACALGAQSLDGDVRDGLLTRIWDLLDRAEAAGGEQRHDLINAIADVWGVSRERARALRVVSPESGGE